jgi:3-dehydroshikimate dehydratase
MEDRPVGDEAVRPADKPMLSTGLVSITFRPLDPEEILRLAVQARIETIEWGGDVHVPVGDLDRARETGRLTREAGLKVSAYGSYFRLGEGEGRFEPVLATAVALGAPTIRIWAGNRSSADCPPHERSQLIEEACLVAEMAGKARLTISLEYHDGTLTDTRNSVRALLQELNHPGIEFFWQPSHGESTAECAGRLDDVLPRLRNVHVFHWWPTFAERHPLAEGETAWRTYIDLVRRSGRPVEFLLEFVRNDSPAQFLVDVETLHRLLGTEK